MTMRTAALGIIALALASRGRRVQKVQRSSDREPNAMKALASLLLATNPEAGWQSIATGPGRISRSSRADGQFSGIATVTRCSPVSMGLEVGETFPASALSSWGVRGKNAAPSMVQETLDRRTLVQQICATSLATAVVPALQPQAALATDLGVWQQVDLPIVTEAPILFDIEFDPENPKNGWIVGNRGTFLQTSDGGKSWTPKSFANLDPDEEINYRFTKVSFKNGEGWIIGKPAILLHTRDSGSSWERVPLSPKLPGDPYGIVALGPGRAEMTTSAGAIYTTENAGRNWKAEVRETIDATLNRVSSSGVQGASYFSGSINSILRDSEGSYLAVSSRGNFYLTWTPGDEFWIPHNRETSRRITSMGFVKDRLADGLWMTTAGGEISKTTSAVDTMQINIPFDKLQIRSGGYGLLDVIFLPSGKAWAVGGGGTIFSSSNNGQSWTKDKVADNLPSNLYKIKFFGEKGYILGSNGVLLRTV